ncbi:hypothetical protein GO730_03745 [Spirosoma sp. HMF3257]|uniref:Uncharacterized protein n=1 Tax=Spirosoma telluris TaxID=2183553 RepID=A0A327NIH4_9BACT|nr:hypothetical protein [Spirosoma telluris]RAI73734.1 hypothetical protein HMF3257_03685 [Spirosoma telluris]
MNRETLMAHKERVEALLFANVKEVEFIRQADGIDLVILDTYYLSGRALAAEHMQIINQLEQI